jgi:hypothetical protein
VALGSSPRASNFGLKNFKAAKSQQLTTSSMFHVEHYGEKLAAQSFQPLATPIALRFTG